jgi:predicted permease
LSLLDIGLPIALAVLKVAAIAAVGWFLSWRRILHDSAVSDVSELVIKAFAPCLIFSNAVGASKMSGVAGPTGVVLIVAGPALLGLGYGLSALFAKVFKVERGYRTAVVAASTFQNQLYLPLAVGVAVVPSLAQALMGQGTTTAWAVAGYVIGLSIFGIGYGPFFWGIGLSWITSDGKGRMFTSPASLLKLIPAPIVGLIAGFVVALTPLRLLLAPAHAPLRFVLDAATDLGSVAVPLANLILGAMLARAGLGVREPLKNVAIVIGTKLIAVPGICLAALYFSRAWWRHTPDAAIVAFVLLVESMSPPATNLATMSKRSPDRVKDHENKTAEAIPRILLITYILTLIIMPLWLVVFVHLAEHW